MKWEQGRQGGSYKKLKVWLYIGSYFATDCWILKYEPNYDMPVHTDDIPNKNHYRINIVLKGKGQFIVSKTILNLFNRVFVFRPDLYEHSMINGNSERIVLSIGFVTNK